MPRKQRSSSFKLETGRDDNFDFTDDDSSILTFSELCMYEFDDDERDTVVEPLDMKQFDLKLPEIDKILLKNVNLVQLTSPFKKVAVVLSLKNQDPLVAEICTNFGQKLDMVLDCGSQVSLLSPQTLNSFPQNSYKSSPSSIILRDVQNNVIPQF